MVSNVVTTLTLGEDDYTLEDHMVLNDWVQLQRQWDGLWRPMPSSCADLDGIYVAIHASLQSAHYRWNDVREMCRAYLRTATHFLNDEKWVLGIYVHAEGTHLLHGPFFSVAECQHHFPAAATSVTCSACLHRSTTSPSRTRNASAAP